MEIVVQVPRDAVRPRFDEPVTDAQLLRFCAQNELLGIEREPNGELVLTSPSRMDGGWIGGKVFGELYTWANADGTGTPLGPNSEVKLADNFMRAADASWMSWARFHSVTDQQRQSYAPVCPEFVIEVRSQSDRLTPRQEKMQMWLTDGAELAWLIDPERKTVGIYRPNDAPEVFDHPTTVQGSGPVAGLELVLSRIWS